jgi:gliding motility-associated-like protein
VSNVSGGMPPYAFSFSDGPFVTNPYFGGLAAGNYSLVLEDANGCQLNTSLILADGNDLSVDLGEDQVVEWGEEADIYPFLSVDSAAISLLSWQTSADLPCPDCLYQLDLLLDESTRFFLSVVDNNGCVAEDDVTIYVEKNRNIYVPNVFSPNGDGTNDRFYVFTDQRSVKEIREMKIFNRWGVHVFENYNFQPNNPHEGWDGRLMGEVLNPDVFAWYAIVELIDGQVIKLKGDVTLVK